MLLVAGKGEIPQLLGTFGGICSGPSRRNPNVKIQMSIEIQMPRLPSLGGQVRCQNYFFLSLGFWA